MSHKLPFAVALVLLLLAAPARGQAPFVVNAQTTTGAPTQATVSGSSIIDLVENLIESQGQFANFQNQGFDASLNYGAITDAIQFQRNAAGTSATVTIPSTGFSRTFTGGNETEVREQIEDFLLQEGAREYARFMRQVNERSLLGVTDGNPQAATAILSNSAFARFGLHRSPMDANSLVGGTPYGGGLRLDLNGGVVDTDEGDGIHVNGSLSSISRLGDRIGIAIASPFSYREVEDAKVYMGGLEIGIPIVLWKPIIGRGPIWLVTPHVVGAAAGSEELAAGGLFFGGGGTSSLSLPLGDLAALTVGGGLYFYQGYELEIADYAFDTDLNQEVGKIGAKLTQALGPVFLDVGITYTDFFQESAVDNYVTPTLGIGTGFGSVGLRVAYQGDFADGYRSHGGMVSLYLNY